jgi:hypothetical protein
VVVTAGAVALFGALAGAPLQARAAGETGSPSGSGTPGASGDGMSNCPSSNPPNQLTLVAGTPQTAILQSVFATGLQVALTNSDGCPVTSAAAGVPVTFSAPAGGASGVFSTSDSNTAIVGADTSGAVAAPPFTANDIGGSYTVTAGSQYGSVSFSLTNTAAGIPARILAITPKSSTASVASRYAQPLQVEVLDAGGNPVAGTTVTFTLGTGGPGACGTTVSAGASFTGGSAQATATTGASGVASSPAFTANSTAGSFTATAAVAGKEPAGGSGKEASAASSGVATPASFSLANVAGKPAKLTTGVGSTQSTTTGARFPIRLAVTVTDAKKNPVADARVTFSAPARGASGRFTTDARGSHRRRPHVSHPDTVTVTVTVKTNVCGIAVAPPFTADGTPGGYVVKAAIAHAKPAAAFALVNELPGGSP